MVQCAIAIGHRGCHELRHNSAERRNHTGLAGGGRDDAEVLVVQLDAETGIEVALQHLRSFLVEHRRAGQSAAQHLHRGVDIHAVGLQEGDRFGEQLDIAGDDQLVGGLDRLARTVGPDVDDGLADDVENRLGRGEIVVGRTDHDRQRGVLGAGLTTGHGCVDDAQAALGSLPGQFGRDVGTDAGEVDHQGAWLRMREDAVVSQ